MYAAAFRGGGVARTRGIGGGEDSCPSHTAVIGMCDKTVPGALETRGLVVASLSCPDESDGRPIRVAGHSRGKDRVLSTSGSAKIKRSAPGRALIVANRYPDMVVSRVTARNHPGPGKVNGAVTCNTDRWI